MPPWRPSATPFSMVWYVQRVRDTYARPLAGLTLFIHSTDPLDRIF